MSLPPPPRPAMGHPDDDVFALLGVDEDDPRLQPGYEPTAQISPDPVPSGCDEIEGVEKVGYLQVDSLDVPLPMENVKIYKSNTFVRNNAKFNQVLRATLN